jgi:hypothetical protein
MWIVQGCLCPADSLLVAAALPPRFSGFSSRKIRTGNLKVSQLHGNLTSEVVSDWRCCFVHDLKSTQLRHFSPAAGLLFFGSIKGIPL